MEGKIIRNARWLAVNGRARTVASDAWYVSLCNALFDVLRADTAWLHAMGNWNGLRQTPEECVEEAALRVALYMQDALAQTGGWCSFKRHYRRLYGQTLPFYPLDEAYVEDEINPEDVCVVLWSALSRQVQRMEGPFTFCNPYDEALCHMGRTLYHLLDTRFEEAPVSSTPSPADWLMPEELWAVPSTPLPAARAGEALHEEVTACLNHSAGHPLLYFATYPELACFFRDVLHWSHALEELRSSAGFVIYANEKGMLVAHNVAAYFADPTNPCYDARRAAATGFEMVCSPGCCPFDLLKYGMTQGLLPALALPFAGGAELLHTHWDFFARYYLFDFYEGR